MTIANMADLYITHVRCNQAETNIDMVKIGSSASSTSEQPRSYVVEKLDAKKNVETSPPSGKGAKVEKVIVKGTAYIRTDANSIEKDNLGSLPRF